MTNPESGERASGKDGRSFMLISVLVLIAVAAIAGAAIFVSQSKPMSYACISIGYNGSDLKLTTSGLIHIDGSKYYVSCNEGSPLPTSSLSTSCLTITSQIVTSPYPGAASTYYYYVTAPGHTITLQGASANSTVIVQPNDASILVDCS